jgi:hypothetical protein
MVLLAFNAVAQKGSEKKDNDRVEIFTPQEKDNLQMWFHDEIKKMDLTYHQQEEYIHVLVYYMYKIGRLDDTDNWESKEYFQKRLNEYLEKQDAEIQEILSEEQFEIHKEIYGTFLKSASKRWGIEE